MNLELGIKKAKRIFSVTAWRDRWMVLMQFVSLIKTASVEANFLAVISATLLMIKIFFLNLFPSGVFGFYELGVLVEAVLASVVASYVFYILVVHVKEQTDRKTLSPYVGRHSRKIVEDCSSQLLGISAASGVSLELSTVTKEEIAKAFSKIDPYSFSPLMVKVQQFVNLNWLQYFINHKERSKESIQKLIDKLPFLDTVHVKIITEIDDCSHFFSIQNLNNLVLSNSTLEAWGDNFYNYCLLCKELNSHLIDIGLASGDK